jgi:hypothetical protein
MKAYSGATAIVIDELDAGGLEGASYCQLISDC